MSEPTIPPNPPPPPSYTPPPPPPGGGYVPPPSGGGTVSPNRTLMIVLSYLWVLALVPFLMEKEDREVQWHAKNGLVLFLAEIAVGIVLKILAMADAGCLSGCVLGPIVWVVFLVVQILCIVKGVNGQRFIIPGLSQFADRF